jgi:hypothetical protein
MPYKAGHVLTENEANTLNWCRADLIQKMIDKLVKRTIKELHPEEMLSFDEALEIQRQVDHIDANYTFSVRKPPLPSFLDRELTTLAIATLRRQGHNSPTPEQIDFYKQSREIQERARRLINTRFVELFSGDDDDERRAAI